MVYAKGTVTKDGQAEEVDRLFADKEVYFRAMEVRNTPPLRRNVIYWGVRLGGWYSWGRYRRKQRREEVEGKVAIEIGMLPESTSRLGRTRRAIRKGQLMSRLLRRLKICMGCVGLFLLFCSSGPLSAAEVGLRESLL